eukprot:jgi/Galph1/3810/GphlegSOOS_G2457.1
MNGAGPRLELVNEQIIRVSQEVEAVESNIDSNINTNVSAEKGRDQNHNKLAPLTEEDKYTIRFNAFGTAAGAPDYVFRYFSNVNDNNTLQATVGVSMLYGVMFGLLIFGFIADFFGRKKGLIACSCFVLLGNILGIAMNGTTHTGMIWMMCIALGVAGIGMGGEYTCNVPNVMEDSEQLNTASRGRRVAILVMCLETLGNYAPFVVQLLLVGVACRNAYLGIASGCNWNVVARLSFACATFPVLAVLIFRTRMKDSLMFKRDQQRKGRRYDILDAYVICRHFIPRTIGTVIMWFLIDWINYSQGTFGALILEHVIGVSLFKSIWLSLATGAAWGMWMPFVAAFVVDKWGRRKTEMFGWFFLAATQIINSGFFWQLKAQPIAWIIWSTFVGGFQNFVFIPVYLVPAEAFPTRIRATMYGISSSLGKMGGIVGTTTFPTIWRNWSGGVNQTNYGLRKTMWFYGGMEFLGLLICTFFVPEYSHRSLLGEDNRFIELRRRYAARFAMYCGVNESVLQNNKGYIYSLKNLIVAKITYDKERYLDYRLHYAAYLAKREELNTMKRIQYVASLSTDYKDLTWFSELWVKYHRGKEGYVKFLENSEEMGFYDASKEEEEMEEQHREKEVEQEELPIDYINGMTEEKPCP